MKVPLLDLQAQYGSLRAEVEAAMRRVCDSQVFIQGPEVQALESELASFLGAAHAIAMSSGTDALLAALMALDIGPGDEVITSPYSFFATAGVIARLRATPVFVDIEPESFNLDVGAVEARMSSRTKAIVPVHLFGRMAAMEPLLELAKHRAVAVIEDAAQAIGAFDAAGRKAGVGGLMGCYSFFPSKNLGAFGDGGMVVTNDPEMAERLRMLRVHGSQPKYYHRIVGGNFRLDALQAAILRVKLPHLEAWTLARRANAERYRGLFAELGAAKLVTLPRDLAGHIYNQFVIRVDRRDELREYLTRHDIGSEIYYPIPLHLQECFAELGHARGSFPEAEHAALDSLAIPIYPELSEEQQRYVVQTIHDYYNHSA